MYLYTHLAFAAAVREYLQPADLSQYYLGAVAPDLRYPAGLQRRQTHLTSPAIFSLMDAHPELRSFLLGYLLHCEMDLLDLTGKLFQRSPLRFLSKRLQLLFMFVYLEDWYLGRERLNVTISAQSNAVLSYLGVPEAVVADYAARLDAFLAAPSLKREVRLLSGELAGHPRAAQAAQLIGVLTNPLVKAPLLLGVPLALVAQETPARLMRSQPLASMAVRQQPVPG